MKLVATSTETIRVPVSAVQAGELVDPSIGNTRAVTAELVPQGDQPSTFPIVGAWEAAAPSYWVSFPAPGNLTRGTRYMIYLKLATLAGETPILKADYFIEAI